MILELKKFILLIGGSALVGLALARYNCPTTNLIPFT
jgi:hypothetical protein